jgi:hypothetical protein
VIALVPNAPPASIVLRSACIPAPPPESLPATVKTTGGLTGARVRVIADDILWSYKLVVTSSGRRFFRHHSGRSPDPTELSEKSIIIRNLIIVGSCLGNTYMRQKTVKITIQGMLFGNTSLKLYYFLDFMPVEHKGLIATTVPRFGRRTGTTQKVITQ